LVIIEYQGWSRKTPAVETITDKNINIAK